jgi:hypothetical protein
MHPEAASKACLTVQSSTNSFNQKTKEDGHCSKGDPEG